MLLYYHSWMFYNNFIIILYHFSVLTYWHSAQCQLLVFACFLLRRKSIPNGVQTQRNFLWIFYGPADTSWAEEVPKGCPEGGTTHQGAPRARLGLQACPGGLCSPRSTPEVLLRPTGCLLVQKKSTKSFDAFGLRLVLISCDVKNMQKIAIGTGLYVNRLVPKMI